ncbi:hypothetical protein CKM354_000194500 [Cercospora kikuchii]|uniref:GST N-terminal domain-containing protein n=1 Tax=Cercospora kikuchii TaxID=84275 RepID=A0A9P3C6N9_9PEZI|nr:uncharacterized protein CKM354_000194500 [Cercospora kikuchii]GIZ38529.1 hypothetical protein CKM354_000194500 [Cercospora kikuchii]
MAASQITLYDLPTKKTDPPTCWSPNVWKTRLVLNYKGIPYNTTFLKHPDIEPTLSSIGIPPNPPMGPAGPQSRYTVPAIHLPDGTAVMDSARIAPVLEKSRPEPSLHLENGLHEQAGPILGQVARPLLGVFYPLIMLEVLLDDVAPYWRAKREAAFDCTIEEFEAAKGGEGAWQAAQPGFDAMEKFLKENKKDQGPFILGSQVCYGDFIIAAMAEAMSRINQALYDRLIASCAGVKELHEACREWFEKDT